MSTSLIPTHNGKSPVNGLLIQSAACVIIDNDSLEILDIAPTHNRADERATDLFVVANIDARANEIRYYSETIEPKDLIGMKASQFQHFVENNNHPLIAN